MSRLWRLWLWLFLAAAPACREEPCGSQQQCRERGLCVGIGSQCSAGNDADCKQSVDCEVNGLCGEKDGRCFAFEVRDCTESRGCKDLGRCHLVDNACAAQPAERDTREGCPCGCDHSIEMTAALRKARDTAALTAIDDTLSTIAEREDAGYITDAMVEHRIRTLDLLADLEPRLDDPRPRDRGVPLGSDSLAARAGVDGRSLRVHAELSAHGQTTEVVRGHEKLVRASFRVGLSLENKTSAPLTVTAPTIVGSVGMPISRWYELGTDGTPWDGVLAPGETKAINVIGYLSEAVEPGALLQASVTIDSLTLETRTIAAAHWAGPQ